MQYDPLKILNQFVNVEKPFSIEHLNHRIAAFPFHCFENKPPTILDNSLKTKLKSSSTETISLFRILPLIISDFVPQENP